MILDQRCITILTKIVYAPSYVSPLELMEELNVSKRTVYYDVEKINNWLKANQLEALNYVRSAGFYVSNETKNKIIEKLTNLNKQKNYEYSPKERVAWTLILILTRDSTIFLQDLMDKLNVSRSTLLSDIKQLKGQLAPFSVCLTFHKTSGYYIEGEEVDKRKVLVYFLSQVMTNRGWEELFSEIQWTIQQGNQPYPYFFNRSNLDRVYEIINESEPLAGVHYTDEVIQNLSVHLFLLIKRFTQGKHIQMDPVEKEVIKRTSEFEAAQYICKKIECAFELKIPEDEIYYITTYLLGAKVIDYKTSKVENQDLINLKKIITRMVDDFQKYACVFFENRMELERNLFIHLKPAYFRIKYGVQLDYPLSKPLQESYDDLIVLTKKVIHHFEYTLGVSISDDEIAYIAMHFGGWIDKEGVKMEKRKKAIVVCASGIGTSRILQKQIEDLLPNVDVVDVMTVREYKRMDLNKVNFVISTTPIMEKQVPVFVVNPILTPSEKTFLLKQIQSSTPNTKTVSIDSILMIVRKHANIQNEEKLYQELKTYYQQQKDVNKEVRSKPMLKELLTPDKIQFADKVDTWETAIQLAAQPLLIDQSITQNYVDAMIENVHKVGPYIVIAPGIALPHARPEEGVNKLGMSFLQLTQGCSFPNKPDHQVQLFFVLAAIDNETHLRALSQLSKMLSEPTNVERLKTAETVDDVNEMINQYSNM